MGWNDRLYDSSIINFKQVCPKCGKRFRYSMEAQTPGFRFKEDLACPYCNHVIKSSLEFEFSVSKEEEE